MTDPQDIYCFIHVMKTGGSSLRRYVNEVLTPERIFPRPGVDPLAAWLSVAHLQTIAPERRAGLIGYGAHWPAYAVDMVGATRTFTLLRDPVDRVVSHLRQQQRAHHPDWSLERLYEDRFTYQAFLDNIQARVFAMAPEDGGSFMAPLAMSPARLDQAKERIAGMDVVGFREDHAQAVRDLQVAFGWPLPKREWRINVGTGPDVSEALRERIAEDMRWDRELYDFARRLVTERRERAASAPRG